jgi:Helicase Lhr winged helix domain
MRHEPLHKIRRCLGSALGICSRSTWSERLVRRRLTRRTSIKRSSPLRLTNICRADFDATLEFVATRGYALKSYERFARVPPASARRWRIANPRAAQLYRLNVGTIVEGAMLKIRLVAAGKPPPRNRAITLAAFPDVAVFLARLRSILLKCWRPAIRLCSAAKF